MYGKIVGEKNRLIRKRLTPVSFVHNVKLWANKSDTLLPTTFHQWCISMRAKFKNLIGLL